MLNLTPHAVRIFDTAGTIVIAEIPPGGPPVRVVTETQMPYGSLDFEGSAVPLVTAQRFTSQVTGLPAAREDGTYPAIIVGIVGLEQVAAAYPGRVYATDMGPDSAVRDAQGQILGVRRLQQVHPRQFGRVRIEAAREALRCLTSREKAEVLREASGQASRSEQG